VAHVTKSITLRGGYAPASWLYDPTGYSTFLDGQHSGAGVIVAGPATVTLSGLRIVSATAGISVTAGTLTLQRTWVYDNVGHGVELSNAGYRLDNNVIGHNDGAGLRTTGASVGTLRHNTFARNAAPGIYIAGSGGEAYVTNTIFYDHGDCTYVDSGSQAQVWNSLWFSYTTQHTGSGGFVVHSPVYSDPVFLNPAGMDYHIGEASAARDAGLDTGLSEDIDGEARPMGRGPDIGADELPVGVKVTKQVQPDPVYATTPGAQITYTIQITNTGQAVLHAAVTDTLPAQVSTTDAVVWTGQTIAPQDVWKRTIVGTIETGYAGVLTNVVQVTTVEGATDIYTVTSLSLASDLTIVKRADPPVVDAGGQVVYTIRVTNTGNVDLTATITDTPPQQVTTPQPLTWSPIITAPGGTWEGTLAVTVEEGYAGTLTNVVRITTLEGATGIYTVTSLSLAPHLSVTKQADPPVVDAGGQVAYTIRVTNTGNVTLTATVTDVLPTHVSHVTATDVLTWSPVTIPAPGGVWTQQFAVTADQGYSGTLTNTVRVATVEGATGACTETSRVEAAPPVTAALTVIKQAEPSMVQAGEQLSYTIRVTNTGAVSLTATITDFLPTEVTPGAPVVWTSQLIPPGETWTEQIVVTVNVGAAGPLVNVVRVTSEEGATGAYTETTTVSSVCVNPLSDVVISGPTSGYLMVLHTFTADVTPVTATLPIEYTWQATGNSPVVHITSAVSDTVAFSWSLAGQQTVTVTAVNSCDVVVSDTHTISTLTMPPVYLPLVMRNYGM